MSPTILWADAVLAHRPPCIRTFLRNLASSECMRDLPESAQRVLFFLSSLIDKDGKNSKVFPSKKKISESTGISEITVFRALTKLEEKNLIVRGEQEMVGHGRSARFSVSPIFLGSLVLDVFRKSDVSEESKKFHDQRPDSGDAYPHEGPSIMVTGSYMVTALPIKKEGKKASRAGICIPADLAWLSSRFDLSASKVVSLMSLAKRHGKRLQDVLSAKMDTIQSGTIRNIWGYLAHLLRSTDTDFKWIATQRAEKEKAILQARAEKDAFEVMCARLAGKRFVGVDQTRYEITSNGQFCYIQPTNTKTIGCAPMTPALARKIDAVLAGLACSDAQDIIDE